MEKQVNKRVLALKDEYGLNTVEFCAKANVSNGTLANIQKGENINAKTIASIVNGFGLNRDWLLTGKGEKLANEKLEETNPYKDALVNELKSQVTYLQEMLKMALSGKVPANFNKGLAYIGLHTSRALNSAVNLKN